MDIDKTVKEAEPLIIKANYIIEKTVKNINYEIILMYWQLGKIVFNYKEKNNSKYGDAVIKVFSSNLSLKYGNGFGITNIKCSINFYKTFKKSPTSDQFKNVTWSHCREIINLSEKSMISFYLAEINNKNLTVHQLRNYLKTKSYERTLINQKKVIKNEIEKTLKDPIILNIENKERSEKDLENEIIKNIFCFMKEIGDSVMLYARQYKININGLNHKIDLVLFDNYINSYILVDLKIGKVCNQDFFQMKMYIDYFNKYIKKNKCNNTIGIILCETKDLRVLNNSNIYQIKFLNEIPKEKDLIKIIKQNKIILLKTRSFKWL